MKAFIMVGCLTNFGIGIASRALAAPAHPECADAFTGEAPGHAALTLTPESLWSLLNGPSINGAEVIRHLSRDPKLKSLFEASAGVKEGYTIQEHTLMVFDVFADQYGPYSSTFAFKVPADVRLIQLLKFTIALHDIGKPQAVLAGDKSRQHEFTIPILDRELSRFGFTNHEAKLAHALVGNDILGDLVKGVIDTATAKAELAKAAEAAEMSLVDYAPIQYLFYVSDAASYPKLRKNVFQLTSDGRLVPNKSQLEVLWTSIKGR